MKSSPPASTTPTLMMPKQRTCTSCAVAIGSHTPGGIIARGFGQRKGHRTVRSDDHLPKCTRFPAPATCPAQTPRTINSAPAVPFALQYRGEGEASAFKCQRWSLLDRSMVPGHSIDSLCLRNESENQALSAPTRSASAFRATLATSHPNPAWRKSRIVLAGTLPSPNERNCQVWIGDMEL